MNTNHQKLSKLLAEGKFGDKCCEYWGARNSHGYGVVSFTIRPGLEGRMAVHRLSLEYKLGRELKEGNGALHTCDNRLCFNPNHLYEGTQSRNQQDAHDRGRHPSRKGSLHPLSKLTEQNVKDIKELKGKVPQSEIAKTYGVTQQTISKIVCGNRWKHA